MLALAAFAAVFMRFIPLMMMAAAAAGLEVVRNWNTAEFEGLDRGDGQQEESGRCRAAAYDAADDAFRSLGGSRTGHRSFPLSEILMRRARPSARSTRDVAAFAACSTSNKVTTYGWSSLTVSRTWVW